MYTGPLYPEWPYSEWATERRREVEHALVAAVTRLAEHYHATGRHGEALLRYERLVAIAPEREAFHRGLMSTYAQTGEKAFALRRYHACRAVLRRELGVGAGTETRDLYRLILEDRPVSQPSARAPAWRRP